MLDLLWIFAKPFYKIYLKIDVKKYKLLKIIILTFCLIIYPPLITFYIFRINIINKFRLYIYSLLKFILWFNLILLNKIIFFNVYNKNHYPQIQKAKYN